MIDTIVEPTLLINKKKCLSNISKMADKALRNNLLFRPHFKTHQSLEVGEWYRDFGVSKITVSSVKMAKYFSEAGWKDITIAFPLNPREISRINSIPNDITLNLTIENFKAIELISPKLSRPVNIFIKIDTGYNRTGIWYEENEKIEFLLQQIDQEELATFKGLLIHAGHTYNCNSRDEILEIHQDSLLKIKQIKSKFSKMYPDVIISYGDTPSCSIADDFANIDEIRPGNFVFYDLMQNNLGSCTIDDIAVTVACPVVAKHSSRNQIILHGGAVHFSKEYLYKNDRKFYGLRTFPENTHHNPFVKASSIISLSQEHGVLEILDQTEFERINIGDLVFILPIHSCLTSNLLTSPIIYEKA